MAKPTVSVNKFGIRLFKMIERASPKIAARLALLPFNYARAPVPLTEQEKQLATRAEAMLTRVRQRDRLFAGRRIATYHLPAKGASKGKILINHGWTSKAAFMMAFAEPLAEAGYDVVLWDLPAHGKSGGRMTHMRHMGDCCAELIAEQGPFAAVLTHSVGGPVLGMALKDTGLQRFVNGAPFVLMSTPYSLQSVTDPMLAWLQAKDQTYVELAELVARQSRAPLNTVNFDQLFIDYDNPVHAIHCQDDPYIPFSNTERFAAHGAKIHPLSGMGHRAILYNEQAINLVKKLLVPSGE